jgi:hypothetical protein
MPSKTRQAVAHHLQVFSAELAAVSLAFGIFCVIVLVLLT